MSNVLTVYYSRKGENYFGGNIRSIAKGNTERVAEYIQKAVGGDLLRLSANMQRIITNAPRKQWLKRKAMPDPH